ncbi:DUF2523 family protein [Paraherbaspirillum soli]|uniref:DUF2523 family protein n=1 Tax=Paraherbaspirillum soli TaxID=631222 RepID=A0ABW0MFZ4_9BURK
MFLAVFLPALMGALASLMASLVWRAVLAIGIGFITYTGSTVALNAMKQAVVSGFSGMPADMVNLLAFLWIDKALSVLFSAVAASLAVRGIGGAVKKMVFK